MISVFLIFSTAFAEEKITVFQPESLETRPVTMTQKKPSKWLYILAVIVVAGGVAAASGGGGGGGGSTTTGTGGGGGTTYGNVDVTW